MIAKVVIAGGTGFLGSAVAHYLAEKGIEIILLVRRKPERVEPFQEKVRFVIYNQDNFSDWMQYLEGADAVLNLAGQNIFSSIWTERVKREIINSRIQVIDTLFRGISQLKIKPDLFIQGSAIGFYGNKRAEICDERTGVGEGFLSEVVATVEKHAEVIGGLGINIVMLRTGIVLDSAGGFLKKISNPYRYKIRVKLGTGNYWISWIFLKDFVRIVEWLILKKNTSGIYNICSPDPSVMTGVYDFLDNHFKPWIRINIPEFFFDLAFRQMARELFFSSLRIVPSRLVKEGYMFIEEDMNNVLTRIYLTD